MARSPNAYCRVCDQSIDPTNTSGHYQQVVGFVKLRKRGANEVKMQRRRPVFICRDCMDQMNLGIVKGQSALWHPDE